MATNVNPATLQPTAAAKPDGGPGQAGPESLIDKHSTFSGNYRSTHNLRIEGVVEGQIECQGTLTIAEQAKVKAKVVAHNVTVAGNLEGEVTCPGRFQILPTGRVVGKVQAGSLDIRAGAFYEGDLSMHNQGAAFKAVEKGPEASAPGLSGPSLAVTPDPKPSVPPNGGKTGS